MFDILYTNDDFLVINKHPNVSVHKDDGDTMLLEEVKKETGDSQLYLIHRLDKMTSGLLLLGRHSTAARVLSQQFADRQINKFYLAIGLKKPKKKQGLIKGDMVRSRRASWKLINSTDNPAITQFFSAAGDSGERVFLCKPYTGKTHQIRVALNSIGSSIVGDAIYSPSSSADRGYLHAFQLQFRFNDVDYCFQCDPSDDSNLGSKWQTETVKKAIETWSSPETQPWPNV
ncbi:TIGR01621 family pseudouridine synthase [Vibrio sp.]|nr:TIGR01621 family pseudouridine synthase [Vibrio sp.]